jgi:hypothetical protein
MMHVIHMRCRFLCIIEELQIYVHHLGGASDLCASSRRSFRFTCIIKEELQIYVHHLGAKLLDDARNTYANILKLLNVVKKMQTTHIPK